MGLQPESKSSRLHRQGFNRLQVYTSCVSGLGLVLLIWSLSHIGPLAGPLPWFMAMVIVSELMTIEVFMPQISFSISSAVTFAALLLLGPWPGALVGMAGGFFMTIVTEILHQRQGKPLSPFLQRGLFNMAAMGLALIVGGGAYVITGGPVGQLSLPPKLLPLVLAATATEFVNAGLVVGVVSLQTGQPAVGIWRQNVSWASPMNIVTMVVGGAGLALGYQIADGYGAAVFFLPVLLTIYAYRLYVRQTKAHLAHLEETLAERVEALKGTDGETRPA